MSVNVFVYKLTVIDPTTGEATEHRGITFGETYVDAMRKIDDYYESDNIAVISHLSCEIEDATVIDESDFEFCLSAV